MQGSGTAGRRGRDEGHECVATSEGCVPCPQQTPRSKQAALPRSNNQRQLSKVSAARPTPYPGPVTLNPTPHPGPVTLNPTPVQLP